jgi:hypothetical protein
MRDQTTKTYLGDGAYLEPDVLEALIRFARAKGLIVDEGARDRTALLRG